MIVRDLMTRDVVSVSPDTPVRKIASRLVEHRIGAVSVMCLPKAPVVPSSGKRD
jgi:CBS-domain-containing membrane protein